MELRSNSESSPKEASTVAPTIDLLLLFIEIAIAEGRRTKSMMKIITDWHHTEGFISFGTTDVSVNRTNATWNKKII